MDPIIRRVFVNAPAPLPPKWLRMASVAGLLTFVGLTAYSKHIAPLAIQESIAKDMYKQSQAAGQGAHH
jgi:hypothetical protein